MTAERRLRVGGWAALLVAILVPVQLVSLFLAAHEPDPFATTPYLVIEGARILALLGAVVGLDGLHRSIAPSAARVALIAGAIGAVVGVVADLAAFQGAAGTIETVLFLAANTLVGVWFLVAGGILLREGGGLARIGWTAELGGLGVILTALAIATDFGGPVGSGSSWIDWFHLLGLFVVVYLVRVWRYVVGGRLPGPGIL